MIYEVDIDCLREHLSTCVIPNYGERFYKWAETQYSNQFFILHDGNSDSFCIVVPKDDGLFRVIPPIGKLTEEICKNYIDAIAHTYKPRKIMSETRLLKGDSLENQRLWQAAIPKIGFLTTIDNEVFRRCLKNIDQVEYRNSFKLHTIDDTGYEKYRDTYLETRVGTTMMSDKNCDHSEEFSSNYNEAKSAGMLDLFLLLEIENDPVAVIFGGLIDYSMAFPELEKKVGSVYDMGVIPSARGRGLSFDAELAIMNKMKQKNVQYFISGTEVQNTNQLKTFASLGCESVLRITCYEKSYE